MEGIGGEDSLYLLISIKLKGKENYLIWKKQIHNLAIANGLKYYIKVGAKIPIVTEEDDAKKSTLMEIEVYEKWKATDAKMKNTILWNYTPAIQGIVSGKSIARDMLNTLKTQYTNTIVIMKYQVLVNWLYIKYNNYKSIPEFVIRF